MKTAIRQNVSILTNFVSLISLSRPWFKADRRYVGEDFVQKVLNEFNHSSKDLCCCIYAALSERGKAILRFFFAEIEEIKPSIIQELAVAGQVPIPTQG